LPVLVKYRMPKCLVTLPRAGLNNQNRLDCLVPVMPTARRGIAGGAYVRPNRVVKFVAKPNRQVPSEPKNVPQ
jgi:hypothetical protein